MSWNLLIHKADPATEEPLPLGSSPDVAAALNSAFAGLRWSEPSECELPVESGFSISLSIEGDQVSDLYTSGGYNHLREFASLCRQQGWRMADAQEGEDLDLNDPYASYDTPQA